MLMDEQLQLYNITGINAGVQAASSLRVRES